MVAILLSVGLPGCKTVRYTAPPAELDVPVATEAAAIPTLTEVRYRALGKVPYRGEITNADGARTQVSGYATIVPTEHGTLRVRTFIDRFAFTSDKGRGLNFQVSDGQFSDYEIDSQGYPRRIHEVRGAPSVTGAGGIDEDVTKTLRDTVFRRSEIQRVTEVINNPVYREALSIGSAVYASNRDEYARRLQMALLATSRFVTDEELAKLQSEPLPAEWRSSNVVYRSSEKIVGVAYIDGYEFLSSRGTIELKTADVRARHTVSTLIDPYSGFPYIVRDEVDQTTDGKAEMKTIVIVFDLPKRFDRVVRVSPTPSIPRSAPDTAPKVPAAPPVVAPPAVRPAAPGEVGTISDLYKTAVPAVTTVLADEKLGSGFFISRNLVVTNAHVVDGTNGVEVELHSGRRVPARVVERGSGDLDLAVLQLAVPVDIRPLKIAKDLPEPGTPVVVIGSPLGLRGTITAGIVGAIRPTARGVLVQVDAAINHGNSGGPVLNRAGEVVGVATSYLDKTQGLGFAVFAGHIKASTGTGPFLVAF